MDQNSAKMVQIKTLTVEVKLESSIQSPSPCMQPENCFGPNIQNNCLSQLAYHRPWRQFPATLFNTLPWAVVNG